MTAANLFAAVFCGDRHRMISDQHLSKHNTDREVYMKEYRLSPDELIAKDFRIMQSSRCGYHRYSKSDWIEAIKKIFKQNGSVFVGDLQNKHTYLYNQRVWKAGKL